MCGMKHCLQARFFKTQTVLDLSLSKGGLFSSRERSSVRGPNGQPHDVGEDQGSTSDSYRCKLRETYRYGGDKRDAPDWVPDALIASEKGPESGHVEELELQSTSEEESTSHFPYGGQ